ncbi:fasciclin-2-like isoform X1 [Daktulosphaira vitifoliae]|uniref:fasciclin-2-like isoform X1 n=1 Tax=Daktulosphaira vitifoliae TaxID=58002 RepID=UPI0021AA7D85|nr:fasciclin-2-like isoform X1 [Daktulosphaira vitifoliae]
MRTMFEDNHSLLTLLLISAVVVSGVAVKEPSLFIKPTQPRQTKPIGSSLILNCQPNVDHPELISNLKWLDPLNRTIEQTSTAGAHVTTTLTSDNNLGLIITGLTESDVGTYTCTATYSNSEYLSHSVVVDSFDDITFVNAPTEQYPIAGASYKIQCKVKANPAPLVDWYREDTRIQDSSRFVKETDGLVIQNVTAEDDGIYKCRAIVLDTGNIQDKNIRVEVHIPPTFVPNQVSQLELVEGEMASVQCTANGKPEPKITWIHVPEQRDLSEGSERFSVNKLTGVLNLNKVSRNDNGKFKCVATNAAGTIERLVNVVVLIKPEVLDVTNVSVPLDREARIQCMANGNPLPSIVFRRVGTDVVIKTGIEDYRISVEHNTVRDVATATLVIKHLNRTDDGLYTCIASNKGGTSMKNGHLTVEFPPVYASNMVREVWTWNSKPVNLTCISESLPNASITWLLNNRIVEGDLNVRKFGNGPYSDLQVTPVDQRYYGVYSCLTKNIHGENNALITLREAHRPGRVSQAKFEVVTATTISFGFIGPTDTGGLKIKAYAVQYKEVLQNWDEGRNKSWPVDTPYILEGLSAQRTYQFRFAAINDVGTSDWGTVEQRTMPKRSAPEEPKILYSKDLYTDDYINSPYGNSYEVNWKIPADNGEFIDYYSVTYCVIEKINTVWTQKKESCRTEDIRSQDRTSFLMDSLNADTFYKVEIRAHNEIGYSVPSELVFKTAMGADIPLQPTYSNRLNSSVIISIVLAVLFTILVIIDVSCYFINNTGILFILFSMCCRKKKRDEDTKLGSEGKELLTNGNTYQSNNLCIEPTETLKKDTEVEYDMRRSVSQTRFVGKDSAV